MVEYITQHITSQEHCTNQVTIALMTTLLPNWVTFIFPSREIVMRVTALGNQIYLFLSPQGSFHSRILLLISYKSTSQLCCGEQTIWESTSSFKSHIYANNL